MPTKTELAYMAGFVDGDGSITLHQNVNPKCRDGFTWVVSLRVQITTKEPLPLFASSFGGKICPFYRKSRGRQKDLLCWVVVRKKAMRALQALLPYLRLKSDRAALAIEAQMLLNTRRQIGKNIWSNVPLRVEEIHRQLKILNHRGKSV